MSRRPGIVVTLVVGALAALVAAGIGFYWFGQSEPTPWSKPAKVFSDVVHLRYIGSQCQDDASVDVEEDDDRVILTIRTVVRADSCPDVGVRYNIDAHLDAPVGDRELVDGACLIPEIAPLVTFRTTTRLIRVWLSPDGPGPRISPTTVASTAAVVNPALMWSPASAGSTT